MESFRPVHLNYKSTTMTSQEILKASMLDILFENRNKQYGAYTLRKFYGNRMAIALAISLSSVLLICFLLPSYSTSSGAEQIKAPEVIITDLIMPPPEAQQPVPAAATPVDRVQKALADYQNIQIVPDDIANELLPTTDELVDAAISNTTVAGEPDNAQHVAPPQAIGNGSVASQHATTEAAIFDPVEKQPEFPGGVDAWRNFLSRYLQAPDELAVGERRTVQVRFIVNRTGQVTDFEILQSAGSSFDREVLRVLKKMPKWKPAIQNGHEIAVSFVQPVTFQGVEE